MLLLVFVCGATCLFSSGDSYEVYKIGNDPVASVGGPEVTGGSAVFLLKEPFPQNGVLFAFSAYFRNRNDLQFQVWRPTSNYSKNFTLISELQITPSVNGSEELVYIVSQLTEKCIRVRPDDRLGVYFANSSAPLAQTFDPFNPKPQTLVHYADGQPTQFTQNQTVAFEYRIFPYDFSLSAYYYIENSTSANDELTIDCPKNQLIDGDPKPTTPTTPLPTGIPGATGFIGLQGDNGVIGITGVAGATGYTGVVGIIGAPGIQGVMGATGSVGLQGPTGDSGDPGAVGVNGTMGATGYTGFTGPIGDIGLPGYVLYSNDTDFNDTDTDASPSTSISAADLQWKSESYMIGLLIWLSIVSALIIVYIIILVVFTCNYRTLVGEIEDVSKQVNQYGMSNTLTTTVPRSVNHGTVKSQRDLDIDDDLRDMREETFANYTVDTTEKYATRKLKEMEAFDNAN